MPKWTDCRFLFVLLSRCVSYFSNRPAACWTEGGLNGQGIAAGNPGGTSLRDAAAEKVETRCCCCCCWPFSKCVSLKCSKSNVFFVDPGVQLGRRAAPWCFGRLPDVLCYLSSWAGFPFFSFVSIQDGFYALCVVIFRPVIPVTLLKKAVCVTFTHQNPSYARKVCSLKKKTAQLCRNGHHV